MGLDLTKTRLSPREEGAAVYCLVSVSWTCSFGLCPVLGAEQFCASVRKDKTFKYLFFIPFNALIRCRGLETGSLSPNLHKDKYLQGIETLLRVVSPSVAFPHPTLFGPDTGVSGGRGSLGAGGRIPPLPKVEGS